MRLAVSVLLLALSGCGESDHDQAPQVVNEAQKPSENGRFVIVHSPHIQRDTILLDTATGETWQETEFTDLDGNPVGWAPMYRSNDQQERDALIRAHPFKAKAKAK